MYKCLLLKEQKCPFQTSFMVIQGSQGKYDYYPINYHLSVRPEREN